MTLDRPRSTAKATISRWRGPIGLVVLLGLAAIGALVIRGPGGGEGAADRFDLTDDGPLQGFADAGLILADARDGDVITHCTVLQNRGTEPIEVTDVDLILSDDGLRISGEPLAYRVASDGSSGPVPCGVWGPPSAHIDGLAPLRERRRVDPGTDLAVLIELHRRGQGELSEARGHVVTYSVAGRRHRELFDFQLTMCPVDAAACEPLDSLADAD